MKSKKIVAMFVALVAIMAVATSGLAAVTTTTTYNAEDATKVLVDVEVTGVSGEVTYLVKSGTQIVYIDQATADGGKVDFEYKISKDKMSDIQTEVKFGTNGTEIGAYSNALPFNAVEDDGENYVIEYYRDANCVYPIEDAKGNVYAGTTDEIYAEITAEAGYTIKTVTGATAVADGSAVYKLNAGVYEIAVETEEVETTTVVVPSVNVGEGDTFKENETITDGATTKYAKTALLKVEGSSAPEKIGVIYEEEEYVAFTGVEGEVASTNYDEGQLYAVRIITGNETINLTPFYYVGGVRHLVD